MDHFRLRGGVLAAESVPLARIADRVGTPTYVYSLATLRRHYRVVDRAFAGQRRVVAYSVKANGNLALLRALAGWGSGFDVVSAGELARVRRAGGDPARTVFAGGGKTEDELAYALRAGVGMFNVESAEELDALDRVGRRLRRPAPFAIRVNPGVDARTHRHIATGLPTSKFGVAFDEARGLYARARMLRGLRARGVDCHIGSQLTQLPQLARALSKVARLYRELRAGGLPLEWLDIGGGLGIRYRNETPPSPGAWARTVREATRDTGATVLVEPGRVLVGNAGVLLTRVLYRKVAGGRTLVIVDAGMNDLLRPALYGAEHAIVPVEPRRGRLTTVDVVGPVCESTDVLARSRRWVLPERGDLLAIRGAGAYGMAMASNYNGRPRPAEVLVDRRTARVVRRRESMEDLWRGESSRR
jgi:diaminopimelate decarboxylase